MKIFKRVLIVLGSLVGLFIVVFGIYLLVNIQGEAEAVEVGSPEISKRVLIASQGSEFKNQMVDTIISRLKSEDIYIRVIDVSGLSEINEENWSAEIIIHTTEGWKAPEPVRDYLDRIKEPGKVMLLITSGDGGWKPEDCKVDVLASASKIANISVLADSILYKVDSLLKGGDNK